MTHEEIEALSNDYDVCLCNSVTLGEILTAIKAGHNTLDAVMDETNAGTACTLCQTQVIDEDNERDLHLDEILEYAKIKGFR